MAADHLAVLINVKMNLVSNCPNLPWQSSYSFYIRSLKEEIVSFFVEKTQKFALVFTFVKWQQSGFRIQPILQQIKDII